MNVHFLLKLVTILLQERKEEVAGYLVTYIDFIAVMSLSPYVNVFVYFCSVIILETVRVARFLLEAVFLPIFLKLFLLSPYFFGHFSLLPKPFLSPLLICSFSHLFV